LWFGSENAGEGNIYRYNILTKSVDLVVSPTLPSGAAHWNNMATDGARLYLGNPTTQYLGFANPWTGVVDSSTTYSPALAGHKEDGAFRASSGTLWRVTFSGLLHETTIDGQHLRTFVFPGATPGLVGLEWVDETLYATDYSAANPGHIGTISLTSDSTATFTVIPWAMAPPGGSPGDWACALAYDPQAQMLYMAGYSSTRLFAITFGPSGANATLVRTLQDVGYVTGGLIDGMGWVAPEDPTDVGRVEASATSLACWPNPSAGEIWMRFESPRSGEISLSVWDLAGRRVRMLPTESAGHGPQLMRWDGRDDAGERAAAGVYLVRLTAGGWGTTARVTLIR
jgi:hypothetical protein